MAHKRLAILLGIPLISNDMMVAQSNKIKIQVGTVIQSLVIKFD